ncbi:hypothetical protein [Rhodopirellula halodulae]|nr:hypothetical protein [Rhodopirellula sp. JC740]
MTASAFIVQVIILTGRSEAAFRAFAFALLPLACIWFSNELGRLTGVSMGIGRPTINEATPGIFVAAGGWLLLLSGIGFWFIVHFPNFHN